MMKTKETQAIKAIDGITLISLVVTIVVLMILAGVSISTILGDDGIITKAQEKAEATKQATAKEELNRMVLEYELARSDETMFEYFEGKKSEGKISDVIQNDDGTITIKKDGYSITVKPSAKTPKVKISEIKVVANSDGTGEGLGAESTAKGKTLYITFIHSITGGTTTVSPSIPYAVTENGTYNFTVTGTVDGKTYTKSVAVTVNQFRNTYEYMKENTQVTYLDGTVWVPEGFKIAADSASTVQGGVVIEDKDDNQFVWIPVANISDYKRTAYNGSLSSYSETLPSDEQISVNIYKGYYIGRYEAGDKESTAAKTLRSSNDVSKTVTIKANQAPYNYVTRTQAKSLAENFGTQQNYNTTIKTKLVSSYAWDTAIAFIQKSFDNYGSSSPQGNYYNTSFKYIDITTENNEEKTKIINSSTLVATGQTTSVCNIYDMGGNVWEWSTENKNDGNSSTVRGGNCGAGNYYENLPAGHRTSISDDASWASGFRITLFL